MRITVKSRVSRMFCSFVLIRKGHLVPQFHLSEREGTRHRQMTRRWILKNLRLIDRASAIVLAIVCMQQAYIDYTFFYLRFLGYSFFFVLHCRITLLVLALKFLRAPKKDLV